jgi:anaerobic magnesium-protoporphyrin IX monomethyl ester cyclase
MKRKILFFSAPSGRDEGLARPPIGIAYLGACLEHEGYPTQGYNFFHYRWKNAEKDLKVILEREIVSVPAIICLSCWTTNRIGTFKLADLAKSINKDTIVAVGGIHATSLYEQILTHYPSVDIIALGEGERTIVELVNELHRDTPDLQKVAGLAFRKDKRVIKTAERELISDIDTLPKPKMDYFAEDLRKAKEGYVYSSRGCYYRCNFCSSAHFWENKWRPHSPKYVVDVIEQQVKDYGAKIIRFQDENFTQDKDRAIAICKEIIKRKINVEWTAETRANQADEELFRWMKRAGCRSTSIGVETGSPRLLKVIKKGITIAQVVNAFKLAHKCGLPPCLMLFVGTPGESRKTIEETKRLIDKVIHTTTVEHVEILEVYPNTPLYEYAKSKGYLNDDYWLTDANEYRFTYENSKEQLQKWATELVLYAHRKKGILFMAKYIFKALTHHPVKTWRLFVERRFLKVIAAKALKKSI